MDYIIDPSAHLLEVYEQMMNMVRDDRAENIARQSSYSQTINKHITSQQELELYMSLGLRESVVTRPTLLFGVDPHYCVPSGESNLERMLQGKPPHDHKSGSVIDLHHLGQRYDAPFVELPHEIHDAPGVNSILHPLQTRSWRKDPQLVTDFQKETKRYWEKRGEELCRTCRMSATTTSSPIYTRPCLSKESSF